MNWSGDFSSSLIIFLIRLGIQVGEIRAPLETSTLEAAMTYGDLRRITVLFETTL